MEKKIENYLKFYLGCECVWEDSRTEETGQGVLTAISNTMAEIDEGKTISECMPYEIKPILKPLSDYKEISSEGLNDINCDLSNQMEIVDLANKQLHYSSATFETVRICLENSIDVFNLIDEGLAINTSELNTVI